MKVKTPGQHQSINQSINKSIRVYFRQMSIANALADWQCLKVGVYLICYVCNKSGGLTGVGFGVYGDETMKSNRATTKCIPNALFSLR